MFVTFGVSRMFRRIAPILSLLLLLIAVAPAAAQTAPLTFDPAVCAGAAEGEPLTDECLAMIEAFPRPIVGEVPQDTSTLSLYSFWRVGPDATPTFDAPGGNVNGEIAAGFNFVNVIDQSVPDWLQIEGGSWIQESTARYTDASYFTGVTLLNGIEYPFAWILDLSRIYTSEYPGGPASTATGRWIDRYERVNIFATAYDDEGWRWYMIGPNQWVKQTFVSKVQPVERPEGVSGRWVAVDLYEQTLVAYEDDRPVFATLVSTGLEQTETNEGLFNVWARLPRDAMASAAGAPRAYALQSVPWVMYFDDSISLHGTYWHNLFGYRQSRGCVNLTISDARWVFEWMLNGADYREDVMNYVYVYSSGEYGVTATGY
jgi:hypothetical protein